MPEREDLKTLQGRATLAVELASSVGAQGVFAWVSTMRNSSLQLRDDEVENMEEARSRQLAVDLYVDGRYFTASTNDLREAELKKFVGDAVKMARYVEVDPFRELPPAELFAGRSTMDLDTFDPGIPARGHDDRLRACRQIRARMVGTPGLIVSKTAANDGYFAYAGASSNGFEGARSSTWINMSGDVTLKDGEEKRATGDMSVAMAHARDLPELDWIGNEAVARGLARVGTSKGPTRKTTMVVDREAMGRLVWMLLSPAFGSAVQQQRSFWADKIGKPALSPRFELRDEPLIPRKLSSALFDDEGIASKNRILIRDGALQALLLDTYYAKKLGMVPNGARVSNLIVTPGAGDRQSIAKDVGKGILVTQWLGGNSDSTTGEYSLGVAGHLIERGEVGAPIGEMNISGNLLELFSKVALVGADPWPYGSMALPTMAFEGVSFSGGG